MTINGTPGRFQLSAGPERDLWLGGMLKRPSGTFLVAHLISEVWDDGFTCLGMSGTLDPASFQPLLARNSDPPKVDLMPTESVMMAGRPGGKFLGRVVLELYSGGASAAVIQGTDAGAIYQATAARLAAVPA